MSVWMRTFAYSDDEYISLALENCVHMGKFYRMLSFFVTLGHKTTSKYAHMHEERDKVRWRDSREMD